MDDLTADTTPTDTVAEATETASETPAAPSVWKARITRCKTIKRDLISGWSTNIDFRRGKVFDTDSDEDRVAVNIDWPQTKAKQAGLFSQMPTVQLKAKRKSVKPAATVFARLLNEALVNAKVSVAMDEVLPDVINASGVGAVIVGYEARTEKKSVPRVDLSQYSPEQQALILQMPEAMEEVEVPVDRRFFARRISPADLLWDTEFTGSDFDESSWIGRSGRLHWSEAQAEFKLTDEDKETVLSGDTRTSQDRLTADPKANGSNDDDMVSFDEIFYWAHRYDAAEKYFKCIKRIVFVEGKTEPVLDEKWAGQKFVKSPTGGGSYVGATKFPIRILTLTYITDEAIPPSDSAIGRPQVNELIRSRSQMVLQRERSMPIRYYDVNRIDPAIQDTLMRGTWQGMIPVQGNGQQALGEVSRANYPPEDFAFDKIAKADLMESWQIGPNQLGSFGQGGHTASEAKVVDSNFQTRIGYERARCGAMFLSIAEVMAGLLSLYGDFESLDDEDKARLQSWDRQSLSQELLFSIRPDSTVLLDSKQRVEQLLYVLNMVGKSGFVNVEPIISEIVELSGIDPADVMIKPEGSKPEPLNISLACKAAEDLMNPFVLALMIKSGQAPAPPELEAAKVLLMSIMKAPVEAGGEPGPHHEPGAPTPPHAGPPDGGAGWEAMPRVTKRPDELGG